MDDENREDDPSGETLEQLFQDLSYLIFLEIKKLVSKKKILSKIVLVNRENLNYMNACFVQWFHRMHLCIKFEGDYNWKIEKMPISRRTKVINKWANQNKIYQEMDPKMLNSKTDLPQNLLQHILEKAV